MNEQMNHPAEVVCPICGSQAEAGCLYGRDSGAGLQWQEGAPSMKGNIETAIGGGMRVGECGWFSGTYAQGIYCRRCRRVVVDV